MYYSHLVYAIGYTENFALSQNGTDQEKFTQVCSRISITYKILLENICIYIMKNILTDSI